MHAHTRKLLARDAMSTCTYTQATHQGRNVQHSCRGIRGTQSCVCPCIYMYICKHESILSIKEFVECSPVYVCMYVCMYVCKHESIFSIKEFVERSSSPMYVCMQSFCVLCICVRVCTYMWVNIDNDMCVYAKLVLCMYVYVCMHVYLHAYIPSDSIWFEHHRHVHECMLRSCFDLIAHTLRLTL